jgi:PurA ssDNA and RNA-binding protein.
LIFFELVVIISYPERQTPRRRKEAEVEEIMQKVEKEHISKHVDIESKRFFFDIKENHKGKYLRITELSGGRSCIVIPLGGIALFKERLGEIIEEAQKVIAEE